MSKTTQKKLPASTKKSGKTTIRTKSNTSTRKPLPTVVSKKEKISKAFTHNAKIYHIVWRDAFSEVDEWHDIETVEDEIKEYLCETVGYLIENNGKNEYYTIASTMTQDDFFCCILNIPKSMVISKKRVQFKN